MPEAGIDIVKLIRTGDLPHLRNELAQRRPPELAETLAALRPRERLVQSRTLDIAADEQRRARTAVATLDREPVATPRHRRQESIGVLTERRADLADATFKDRVTDRRIRPHSIKQLVFRD